MPTLAKLYDYDCCVSFSMDGGMLVEIDANVRQFRATTLINHRKLGGFKSHNEQYCEEEWINTFLVPPPYGGMVPT